MVPTFFTKRVLTYGLSTLDKSLWKIKFLEKNESCMFIKHKELHLVKIDLERLINSLWLCCYIVKVKLCDCFAITQQFQILSVVQCVQQQQQQKFLNYNILFLSIQFYCATCWFDSRFGLKTQCRKVFHIYECTAFNKSSCTNNIQLRSASDYGSQGTQFHNFTRRK